MDILSTRPSEFMHQILSRITQLSVYDAAITCTALWAFVKLIRMSRRRVHTTRVRGPPSPSFTYGVGKILMEAEDPASIYESWAREYGGVYELPSTLGMRRIVLYDPKAITHFYAKESWTYGRTPMAKKAIENSVRWTS